MSVVVARPNAGLTRRACFSFAMGTLLFACQRAAPSPPEQVLGTQIVDPVARRFYVSRAGRPAWDQVKSQTFARIVGGAPSHGLSPGAFAPKPLAGLAEDEALTVAALAYAKALSSGFVDPHKIEPIFTLERESIDLAAGLAQALDQGDLETWYASLPPSDAEYKALSAAYLAALNQANLPSAPVRGAPIGHSLAPEDQPRQLAANLERRRWASRTPAPHRIDVNTAGAFLGYFRPDQPTVSLKTVVGRNDHPTPSIQAAFKRLIANPPWRVPMDIARKEIFPKGRGYMRRERMHIENGQVVQAPGPRSALGLVKLDVEDPYDIYLHDTPSKALFAEPERHRSHGCVRVENAVDFARSIAAETGKDGGFDKALGSRATSAVELGQSIPVRMLYHTAYLDETGVVLFAPDIYGFDEKLAVALGLGQAAAAARQAEPEILFGP
jgi:murein L,D-transpeptidase YcbB/YkuD